MDREDINRLKESCDLRAIYPPELVVRHRAYYTHAHCCFHQDEHASAIITKYTFECKAGCVPKMDIIAFVQRSEAVGFIAAIDFLQQGLPVHPLPAVASNKLPSLDDDLAGSFGRELTEAIASPLLSQGLTMAILMFYKIGWCDSGTDAFTIPMWEDGKLCNIKMYQIYPKAFWWYDGGKRPQESMYGLDKVVELGYTQDVIVVCEGQKDVWSVSQDGFPAVSVLDGAGSWRADYVKQLRPYRLIVPLGDNDDAGRNFVRRVCRDVRRAIPFDWRRIAPAAPPGFDYTQFRAEGGDFTVFAETVTNW